MPTQPPAKPRPGGASSAPSTRTLPNPDMASSASKGSLQRLCTTPSRSSRVPASSVYSVASAGPAMYDHSARPGITNALSSKAWRPVPRSRAIVERGSPGRSSALILTRISDMSSSFSYSPRRELFPGDAGHLLKLLLAQDGSTTRLCEALAGGPVELHLLH